MNSLFKYGLLILILFPSSNLQVINGLPLSSWPEFLAVAFLVPFLFLPALRQSVHSVFQKLRVPPAVFWAACAVVLALKILLLASGVQKGFAGCYRSPAAWTETAGNYPASVGCERSYEDLFGRSKATRLDQTISFGKDEWNLVFLNTSRYDYYDWLPGVIPRDRIPLSARWTGTVDIPAGARLRIQYAGAGSIHVGEVSAAFPVSYAGVNDIEIDIPAGRQNLTLDYMFDDGSRTEQKAGFGPRAQIRVLLATTSGEKTLPAASPDAGWRLIAALADLLLLACFLPLAAGLVAEIKAGWLLLGIFSAYVILCYYLPLPAWTREIAITIGLIGVWAWHLLRRPVRAVVVYAVVVLASLAITRLWLPAIDQVVMRSAGNDPLGFESQSFAILVTGSPEGGEAVFYAQPMFRYIRFLEHALFGDGNALAADAELILFFSATFFLFSSTARQKRRLWQRLLLGFAGAGVIFLGGYYVSSVIRDGLPEYPTWSLLFLALPLLFLTESTLAIVFGFAALAVSFTIRTNQLPAIAWIMLFASLHLWRRNPKAVAIGLIAALSISLLPLAHNLYFGHAFVLTTSSAGMATNLTLPPATWLAFFQGDATAATAVREQVGMLFLVSDLPASQWPTLAAMLFLLLSWIAVMVYAVARRMREAWSLVSIPLIYLAPHFFYVVNTYYPRHIAIAYLAMAAVVFIVFAHADPQPPLQPAPPSAVKSY